MIKIGPFLLGTSGCQSIFIGFEENTDQHNDDESKSVKNEISRIFRLLPRGPHWFFFPSKCGKSRGNKYFDNLTLLEQHRYECRMETWGACFCATHSAYIVSMASSVMLPASSRIAPPSLCFIGSGKKFW